MQHHTEPGRPVWTDSHCHWNDAAFAPDVHSLRLATAQAGVLRCVVPATQVGDFEAVRTLAKQLDDAYALGLHPWWANSTSSEDLHTLETQLKQHSTDPRLVAIGEIGLDLTDLTPHLKKQQETLYRIQLDLAAQYHLPVLLHSRKAVDAVLAPLRALHRQGKHVRGIAHAFNGSLQQAHVFIDMGFKLGFGGAMTFPRALHLQGLAKTLPLSSLVLETDAPHMAPAWLRPGANETSENKRVRNSPLELPRIGQFLAALRGMATKDVAEITTANVEEILPKLKAL